MVEINPVSWGRLLIRNTSRCSPNTATIIASSSPTLLLPTTTIILIILSSFLTSYKCATIEDATLNAGLNIRISAPVDGFSTAPDAIAFYQELSLPIFSMSIVRIDFAPPATMSNITPPQNYSRVRFAILQLHSCFNIVTLSRNATLVPAHHQNGTNLGLLVHHNSVSSSSQSQTFYLHNRNYHTAAKVSLALVAYDPLAPQPGACSMELPMDEVPVLQIHDDLSDVNDHVEVAGSNGDFVTVDTPLAADANGKCLRHIMNTSQQHSELRYTFYHLFLSHGDFTCRSYFNGIRQMMTVNSVLANATRGVAMPFKPQRRAYTRLPGTGMVFATLVRNVRVTTTAIGTNGDLDDGYVYAAVNEVEEAIAAYVPAYTMFCSPLGWRIDCDLFAGTAFKTLATVVVLVGLLRAYVSVVFPWVGAPLDGFVVGIMLTFYVQTSPWWPLERLSIDDQFVWLAGGIVMAVLVIVLMIWCPPLECLTELLAHVLFGFIVSAYTMDTFAAFGWDALKSETWWAHVLVLLMVLASVVLTTILVPMTWGMIVMGAAWGTFAIVQGVSIVWPQWLRSDGAAHSAVMMRNMLLALRLEEFRFANFSTPYTVDDLCTFVVWLGLCGSAVWTQQWFLRRAERHRREIAVPDERTPIVTRWTDGSDDVFESPESNSRFFSRLRHDWPT